MAAPELRTRKWQAFRLAVLAHYPPVCHLCGKPIDLALSGKVSAGPTVDHIRPRSKGGARYDLANVRPAHKGCNSRKRDRYEVTKRKQSRAW